MTATGSGSSSASPSRPVSRARPLVLLDANILFLPVRAGFPLEDEVARLRPGSALAVPRSVLGELDRLMARGTPGAAAARALASKYRTLASTGQGDDAVVRTAVLRGAWVVTADRALRARLTSRGVGVLSPRDRHRLEAYPPRAAPAPRRRRRSPNG